MKNIKFLQDHELTKISGGQVTKGAGDTRPAMKVMVGNGSINILRVLAYEFCKLIGLGRAVGNGERSGGGGMAA